MKNAIGVFWFVVALLSAGHFLFAGDSISLKKNRLENVDGELVVGCFITVDEGGESGMVLASYDVGADDGVHVKRISQDGRVLWTRFIDPSRIDHSILRRVVYLVMEKKSGLIVLKIVQPGNVTVKINFETGEIVSRVEVE